MAPGCDRLVSQEFSHDMARMICVSVFVRVAAHCLTDSADRDWSRPSSNAARASMLRRTDNNSSSTGRDWIASQIRERHPNLISPATAISFSDSHFTYFFSAERLRSGRPEWKSRRRQENTSCPSPEVNAITIAPKTLPVTFEAVGQTEGSREVEVRARVGGILLRRFYNEGSWVKQGTALFKIDPAPYEAALNKLKGTLAQEEAQLEKAKRDEARLKPLFEENAVSRKDYEDAVSARETAQARVQSARAGVTEAQLNLDYTNVQAPINGVTGRAEKSEGSLVAAGTDLLTRMSQVDPIYANFSYSENCSAASPRRSRCAAALASTR